MAKQAIPEELDLLIQEYLTDGIITDKERAVLLRKAEKLGLDVDEIDLYIDAQQQKADQVIDIAAKKKRGQTCPFCGGSVPQLADKCPHCGQHITAEASEELKEIIENLEEALVDFKSGKDFARSKAVAEKYVRKANLYYSNNPKIQRLTDEVNQEIEVVSKKAKNEARIKNIKDSSTAVASGIGSIFSWLTKHPRFTAFSVLIIVIIVVSCYLEDLGLRLVVDLGLLLFGSILIILTTRDD